MNTYTIQYTFKNGSSRLRVEVIVVAPDYKSAIAFVELINQAPIIVRSIQHHTDLEILHKAYV